MANLIDRSIDPDIELSFETPGVDADLSDFQSVDRVIEHPLMRLDTAKFKEILNAARTVSSTSAKDYTSRSLLIQVIDGKICFYSTDYESYLMVAATNEIVETETPISVPFVVSLDILSKVIKAVPNKTVIYQVDGVFNVCLVGGDMPLEVYNVPIDKFIFSDENSNEGITVSAVSLLSDLKAFSGVVSTSSSPMDRRVFAEADGIYASFLQSLFSSNTKLLSLDFQPKDLAVLKLLLAKKTTDVKVERITESKIKRSVIRGSDFEYAFINSDMSPSARMKQDLKTLTEIEGVLVDLKHAFQMADLASALPYGVGRVSLSFDERDLILKIKLKSKGDSVFTIQGAGEFAPKFGGEVVLQASLFRNILKCFDSPIIQIHLSDMGVGISDNTYSAIIYKDIAG